jgi:hypothetical protein
VEFPWQFTGAFWVRDTCNLFSVLYIHVTVHRDRFLFNKQPDALINHSYSVIKLYMLRASSLTIIRSLLLYIQDGILTLLGDGHHKPA